MRGRLIAVVSGLLLVAGCGEDREKATAQPAAMENPPAAPAKKKRARGPFVKVRKTDYGRILTDGKGRALYLFTKEATSKPRCYGACAKAWPVFHARGRPRAGKGVKRRLLGRAKRSDGRSMVTYKGHPLYYYVTDTKPGQVTCQNVDEFGGTWLVVAPSGNAIR